MVAPKQIPANLLADYTMQGQISQSYWYFNDDYKQNAPKVYTQAQIEALLEDVAAKKTRYYGDTDTQLYAAFDKYKIEDKTIAIMGSQYPWYESICLYYNSQPTVIDYHKIYSEHPAIATLTIDEYEQNPVLFDAAISISSFEHDGLGRYGDPLNPNADILAMQKMKRMLKPNGILFLSVPVGKDKLVWNAHRIYGRIRLPHILQGWKILDAFGFDSAIYDEDTGNDAKYQPVFVLQNTDEETDVTAYLNNYGTQQTGLKLHLGCGTKRLPGFINIDVRSDVQPDVVADITNLSQFNDNSAEIIYFCHGFEHVRPNQIATTLAEWKRVLQPGGILRLSMPDFEVMARLYVEKKVPLKNIAYIIHGGQDYPENTHYFSWDFTSLAEVLKEAGFEEIRKYDAEAVNPPDYEDYSTFKFYGQQLSLNVEATKPFSHQILIATSIAPGNVENQKLALESWRSRGFSIVSLNAPEEIEQLQPLYPNITFQAVERDAREQVGKPLVYLDDIFHYLREHGTEICGLINSDIHLKANNNLLSFVAEQANNAVVFSSRVDINSPAVEEGELYSLGFDVFFFDKQLLAQFPPSQFCLGMPWWDYWVPLMALQKKLNPKHLTTQIAYHVKHQTNYSRELWQKLGIQFIESFQPEHYASFQENFTQNRKQLQSDLLQATRQFLQSLQQNVEQVHSENLMVTSSQSQTSSLPNPTQTQQSTPNPKSSTVAEKVISLLCPTRGRPEQALRLALSAINTANKPQRVEALFYVDEDDETSADYKQVFENHYAELKNLKHYALVIGEPVGISKAWNELARLSTGDLLIMAADDQIYNDRGWDDRLDLEVQKYPDEIFCMWFNDGHLGEKLCTFPIVSRKWCQTLGYFVTGIFECFCDDVWIMDIAKRVGRLHYIPDVLTEHLNWRYGKAEIDSTYERRQVDTQGQFKPAITRDKDLFIRTAHYREADAQKIAAVMSTKPAKLKPGIQWKGNASIFDSPSPYAAQVNPTNYILNVSLGESLGNRKFRIQLDTKKAHQKQIWSRLSKGQLYEPEMSKFLAKHLQPGDSFIDIGAHVGYYSLLASSLVESEGFVLAVEPDSANCEAFKNNLQLNQFANVELLDFALGSENQETKFFVNVDNDGGHAIWDVSLHPSNKNTRHNKLVRTIKISTLDDALASRDIKNLKMIKIDAEGAEYQVLLGCVKTFSKYQVPYVLCEINQFGLKQMEASAKAILELMNALDYDAYLLKVKAPNLVQLLPEQYETVTNDVAILFAKPSYQNRF